VSKTTGQRGPRGTLGGGLLRLLLIAVALAASATGARASTPPVNPHAGFRYLFTERVCGTTRIFRHRVAPVPDGYVGMIDAWVNGVRLLGWASGGTTYLFGNHTLIETPSNDAAKELTYRVVRSIRRCATLRVLYEAEPK
jgi:hypothetical protein